MNALKWNYLNLMLMKAENEALEAAQDCGCRISVNALLDVGDGMSLRNICVRCAPVRDSLTAKVRAYSFDYMLDGRPLDRYAIDRAFIEFARN